MRAGDEVLSYNEATRQNEYKRVKQTFVREAEATVEVSIEGESSPLRATAEHPFFVSRARGDLSQEGGAGGNWIPAGELEAGDRVRRPSGEWAQVTQIERHEGRVQVYNFEVADNHNYFVGISGVLVHNQYHTPDQRALRELVDEVTLGGRKPLSVDDAESILDWADEVNYPGWRAGAGDVANPSNWDATGGLPHIHIPGAGRSGHVPVQPGVRPRP